MNNMLLKKDLTAEQLAIINAELAKKEKSKGVMYALWLFLGGIGGHRYYLGDIGYAIGMTLTLGGFGMWTLADVFFIGKRREQLIEQAEYELINQVKAMSRKPEEETAATTGTYED